MKRKKAKAGKANRAMQTGGPSTVRPEKAAAQARAKNFAMFRNLAIFGGIIAILAAVTLWNMNAAAAARDLSRIGNGKPAIVQVHDTTCASCEVLQTQALQALKKFPKDEFEYVVADVRTSEGLRWSNARRLQITTLVFADPQGELVSGISGEQSAADVLEEITAFLADFDVQPK